MNHFDKVTSANGTAIEIAILGCQCLENWLQIFIDLAISAHHHAIAYLEPPDAPAYANIHKLNPGLSQHLGAADVIFIVGVTSINDNVIDGQQIFKLLEMIIDGLASRKH